MLGLLPVKTIRGALPPEPRHRGLGAPEKQVRPMHIHPAADLCCGRSSGKDWQRNRRLKQPPAPVPAWGLLVSATALDSGQPHANSCGIGSALFSLAAECVASLMCSISEILFLRIRYTGILTILIY